MKATPASVSGESFVSRPQDVSVNVPEADVFPSEISGPTASSHFARTLLKRHLLFVALGIFLVLAAATATWLFWASGATTPATGSLRVESDPPGARVLVNGKDRGATPLTLSLNAGNHQISVQHAGRTKDLPVTMAAGATIVHHIAWPASVPTAGPGSTGALEVVSDSPRSTVSIDGIERGVTPLTVSELTPGSHEVVVRNQGVTTRRTVTIEPGATSSLVVSAQPAGVASGWLSVDSRVPLQILENGRIVGTSESERVLLTSGNHDFELVNDVLGIRRSESVRIVAGQTHAVSIDLPGVPVSINAVPWAQVWIDNRPLGETPIANVMQTVGPHELTFRHPELGERRIKVVVTLKEPARISVDMRNR